MKGLILILITAIFFPTVVLAQEATPTPTSGTQVPESDEEIERIQRIKDIVASKVAELNLVERRGIIAEVTDVSNTEIKAVDIKRERIDIDVDELTNFNFDESDFGISDLEVGKAYSFIGLYNRDSGTLLARVISKPASIPTYIEGAISNINENDFQISVIDKEGSITIVDVKTSTNTMIVNEEGKLESSGFSQLLIGERVIVAGFLTNSNTASATRIMHFALIPPSIEVLVNLQGETTVATGSGNTLEMLDIEEE